MKQPTDKRKFAGIIFLGGLLLIIALLALDLSHPYDTNGSEPIRLESFFVLALYALGLWNAFLWIRHFRSQGLKGWANWSIFFTILIFLNPLSLLFLFFVAFAFVFGEVLAV